MVTWVLCRSKLISFLWQKKLKPSYYYYYLACLFPIHAHCNPKIIINFAVLCIIQEQLSCQLQDKSYCERNYIMDWSSIGKFVIWGEAVDDLYQKNTIYKYVHMFNCSKSTRLPSPELATLYNLLTSTCVSPGPWPGLFFNGSELLQPRNSYIWS